ncbi:MAG: NAD-dependent epimerase/dehydratase family protein [Geobacter sp.]|nr:NAD-dependent epimerase/dehydratase family protein [Geobacter sp.]
MNILIIGGAGFLGANLVRRCLREKDVTVTVLDALEPHLRSTTDNIRDVWEQIHFVRGDIRDEHLISEVVQGQDIIFNCAAQTSHPLSIQYPLLDAEINCLGNLKLLESIRLLNPQAIVVYTSSSTVVGKALSSVVDEDHWERPLEIYSANKGVAEKYYRIYHTIHDLKTVVLRFANLFGPYGKGFQEFGFINYFIHLAWSNEEIKIFGSGDQSRNVMFVDDATEILWQAAQRSELYGETYFATGNEHRTVSEIASTIVAELGRGQLTHIPWPDERKRIEIENVRFSSQRLQEMTGWHPRFSLEEGLRATRKTLEAKGRGK